MQYRSRFIFYLCLSFLHFRVSGECAHMVALVMLLEGWLLEGITAIPTEIASTSRPQQWGKPRGMKIRPTVVSEMVIVKPHKNERKRRPLSSEIVDNRFDNTYQIM